MIVSFSLLNELFRAFHIQRWNDRLRPMELIEMDKHAHKMIIAYCFGKYEEAAGHKINWEEIIKFGIYELLRRIIISDIKSPIYREIKKNKDVFRKLNEYIYKELESKIQSDIILKELEDYLLFEPDKNSDNINIRILDAAHIYASFWEFQIIKLSNPNSHQNFNIEAELLNEIKNFRDLIGIRKLIDKHTIINFIDLCNQLRFQLRWPQTPRVPKTSVLGHCMIVACISYFITRDISNCPKRIYNNFFGGLYHDLPEAATRDIISPVKRSSLEFDLLIKNLEQELAEKEIFPLVEPEWVSELKYFTQDEFSNKIIIDGIINNKISVDEISNKYNSDKFNPFDGELIRVADHLSAYLESWSSCSAGIKSEELISSSKRIYELYNNRIIGGIKIESLFSGFKNIFV